MAYFEIKVRTYTLTLADMKSQDLDIAEIWSVKVIHCLNLNIKLRLWAAEVLFGVIPITNHFQKNGYW